MLVFCKCTVETHSTWWYFSFICYQKEEGACFMSPVCFNIPHCMKHLQKHFNWFFSRQLDKDVALLFEFSMNLKEWYICKKWIHSNVLSTKTDNPGEDNLLCRFYLHLLQNVHKIDKIAEECWYIKLLHVWNNFIQYIAVNISMRFYLRANQTMLIAKCCIYLQH